MCAKICVFSSCFSLNKGIIVLEFPQNTMAQLGAVNVLLHGLLDDDCQLH